MVITIMMVVITYICMIISTRFRTPIAVAGCGLLLLYGSLSDTFPANEVLQRFPVEIVILIVVLSIFTKIFENRGLFDYIGDKIHKVTKGNKVTVMILLPTVIYATSLFMNNLSVILIFTFICLKLAIKLDLPIVPILASSVIASNIGGCPLPWADTPAVILTLYTDFNLLDFLTKLFIPCAIFNGLLVIYTIVWTKYCKHRKNDSCLTRTRKVYRVRKKQGEKSEPIFPPLPPLPPLSSSPGRKARVYRMTVYEVMDIEPPSFGMKPPTHDGLKYINWGGEIGEEGKIRKEVQKPTLHKIKLPIFVFVLFISAVCVAPFLNISIAYVSLLFGGLMLILSRHNPEDTLNSLPILDSLVFISALFLIAAVMDYSGILKMVVDNMLLFTGQDKLLIILCIMLAAFLIATFLSAGPACATILPICLQLSPIVGNKLVYAALALGILAGSSMLPWSATGGPVMLGEVNRFLSKYTGLEENKKRIREIFNLKQYIAFSIPFSLTILLLSGLFLSLYLTFIVG